MIMSKVIRRIIISRIMRYIDTYRMNFSITKYRLLKNMYSFDKNIDYAHDHELYYDILSTNCDTCDRRDIITYCWFDIVGPIEFTKEGKCNYLTYCEDTTYCGYDYFHYDYHEVWSNIISILLRGKCHERYDRIKGTKETDEIRRFDDILNNNKLVHKLLVITSGLQKLVDKDMLITDVSRVVIMILLDII